MNDTGDLIFQAQGDPQLTKALTRRLLLRIWWLMVPAVAAGSVLLSWAGVVTPGKAALYGGTWLCVLLGILAEVPRQTVRQNAHKLSLPRAYRVDGSGVHVTAGFATETLPWPAITAVTSARGQIVLWQGWRKATGIPSGGLTPAERDRLLEVLHSRGRSLTPA